MFTTVLLFLQILSATSKKGRNDKSCEISRIDNTRLGIKTLISFLEIQNKNLRLYLFAFMRGKLLQSICKVKKLLIANIIVCPIHDLECFVD